MFLFLEIQKLVLFGFLCNTTGKIQRFSTITKVQLGHSILEAITLVQIYLIPLTLRRLRGVGCHEQQVLVVDRRRSRRGEGFSERGRAVTYITEPSAHPAALHQVPHALIFFAEVLPAVL